MSDIRDLNTLPLDAEAMNKLYECGFRNVGELKGVQPLDLARELSVSADLANQIVQAVRAATSTSHSLASGANSSYGSGSKAMPAHALSKVLNTPVSLLSLSASSSSSSYAISGSSSSGFTGNESKSGIDGLKDGRAGLGLLAAASASTSTSKTTAELVRGVTTSNIDGFRKDSLPITAKDLAARTAKTNEIITFCRAIDKLLGGGIPLGQITEVVGPPGIGKSQLAMQLALDTQIPEPFAGVCGQCVYVDTEGSFHPQRALRMAQALAAHLHKICKMKVKPKVVVKHGQTQQQAEAAAIEVAAETVRKREAACRNLDAHSLLSGIRVFRVHDQTELVAVVGQLERYVTANPRVKLVVIDSVAFHFRHDIREGDINRRTRLLSSLASKLNALACAHHLAVLSTNHCLSRSNQQSSGTGTGTGIDMSVTVSNPVAPIAPSSVVVVAGQAVQPFSPAEADADIDNVISNGNGKHTHPTSGVGVYGGTVSTRYDVGSGTAIVPALGDSWAQSLGTRLFLYWAPKTATRSDRDRSDKAGSTTADSNTAYAYAGEVAIARACSLVKSSTMPTNVSSAGAFFSIKEDGFRDYSAVQPLAPLEQTSAASAQAPSNSHQHQHQQYQHQGISNNNNNNNNGTSSTVSVTTERVNLQGMSEQEMLRWEIARQQKEAANAKKPRLV